MATEPLIPHSEHLKLGLLRCSRSAPLVLALVWCWLLPSESLAQQILLNPPQTPAIYLESFLGVDFGSSLEDAENRYPTGLEETSPLGYPCYHVTGVGIGAHSIQ